jgi:hypothetical protein
MGLVQDKYKVESQALHYSQAAEAMECIRASVAEVPPALWNAYNANGLIPEVADLPKGVS